MAFHLKGNCHVRNLFGNNFHGSRHANQKERPSCDAQSAIVRQISGNSSVDESIPQSRGENNRNFFQSLTPSQCRQLKKFLSSQIAIRQQQVANTTNYLNGTCFSVMENSMLSHPHIWILDFVVSRHVCSNIKAFSSLRPIRNSHVTLLDQSSISVEFSGDISLGSQLQLKDVLYVPQFKFNLISVSSLMLSSNLYVSFFPEYVIIQDANSKRLIGKGSKVEELYVLDSNCLTSGLLQSNSSVYVNKISTQTWHNRLGHLSYQRLGSLKDVLLFDASKNRLHTSCYICPLAKQKRLPFVSHNHIAQQPFELVHCDIWGPFHTTPYTGHR